VNTGAANNSLQADEVALRLLDEVAKNPAVSQRALADRLGIALGLVNTYLKRLCTKGHIKLTTLPRNRIKYIITPQGFAEKARLTCLYMNHSVVLFRAVRRRIEPIYAAMMADGIGRILLWGDGDAAELCYICTRGLPLHISGVVCPEAGGKDFFGLPCVSPEAADCSACDAVLIVSQDDGFSAQADQLCGSGKPVYHLFEFSGKGVA